MTVLIMTVLIMTVLEVERVGVAYITSKPVLKDVSFVLSPGFGFDEPTNDIDLPTIERVESALVAYPGCVVLVTHDEALAASVASRTLLVEGGTVT